MPRKAVGTEMPNAPVPEVLPYRSQTADEGRRAPIYTSEFKRTAVKACGGVAMVAACASVVVAFKDPFWSEARTCIAVLWSLGPPLFLLLDTFWLFDNEVDGAARAKHRSLQSGVTRLWAGLAGLLAYAYLSAT